MISATVSSASCFCWLYRASPSWNAKNIINLVSALSFWWYPCVEIFLGLLEKCVCYDQAVPLTNLSFLCPAALCTPRSNLPVIQGMSWFPTFAFQPPMKKRMSSLVLVLGVVGVHRSSQLQLRSHQWLGCRLERQWCWMVSPGNELRSFCCFWGWVQVPNFGLSRGTMRAAPFLLKDTCPQW